MSDNNPNSKSPTKIGDSEDFPTPETRMVSPISGLEAHLDLNLSAANETGALWTLRFTMGPNVRPFTVPPITLFDEYSPIILSPTWLYIGLAKEADPSILVIVYPAAGSYPHTANLLAPSVVSPDTMNTLQVAPEDQDWSL